MLLSTYNKEEVVLILKIASTHQIQTTSSKQRLPISSKMMKNKLCQYMPRLAQYIHFRLEDRAMHSNG